MLLAFLSSLGNHELDNGVSGLTPFIRNLSCPVLCANLVLYKEPTLIAETNLMNSVIFDINGTQVGVIGYLTPDTKFLTKSNNIEYMDEVVALRKEIAKLKPKGINIFIGLGHSGFLKDLEIAKEVEEIDLVIGGHTNTFLWNGISPDSERPDGPYPTIVKQKSGRLVPVVQAYAYTKYLGKLHLVFNVEGEIISFDGNPLLLDKSIIQDKDILSIVEHYKGDVKKTSEIVVGTSFVVLDGRTCRIKECNMGNLITDSMIYKYASHYEGRGWTDAPIAIIQGGGIRSSITQNDLPLNVTTGDLMIVMPFEGNVVKVTLDGNDIMNMLEQAVFKYKLKQPPGSFLQMSGLKVIYDFRNRPGIRVSKVYVRCGKCPVPEYTILNKTEKYNVLMPDFLHTGGDGYKMLVDLPSVTLNFSELSATSEYIETYTPILPAVEGRLTLRHSELMSNGYIIGISPVVGIIAIIYSLI